MYVSDVPSTVISGAKDGDGDDLIVQSDRVIRRLMVSVSPIQRLVDSGIVQATM